MTCRCGHYVTKSAHGLSPECTQGERESAVVSSLKDTNATESGPLPYDLINLSHILRGLISTYEFRASTYELREGYRYSVHNNILIK